MTKTIHSWKGGSYKCNIYNKFIRFKSIWYCIFITQSSLAGIEDSTITITAGDGIQFASGDGVFTTNQSGNETIDDIAIDVSDFAGTGLEDDGSENLRLKEVLVVVEVL